MTHVTWSAADRRRLCRSTLANARPLATIAALLLTPLIPSPLQSQNPTYRISGTVVNSLSSTPLPQARIALTDIRNPANVLSTLTSDDGRFDFPNVPAGKFSLQGARRGYVPSFYDQHENFSTAIATGLGLTSDNLLMRLTPFGAISGKVLDESGEPVRQATVALYSRGDSGSMDSTSGAGAMITDDQGSFELTALAPGTYFIAVDAQPWYAVHPPMSHPGITPTVPTAVDTSLDVAYPTTFYDSATDPAGATPIAINGGDHIQLDIHINPVPALHVIVHVPTEGPLANNAPMLQTTGSGPRGFVGTQATQFLAPGLIEMSGIPPGKYTTRMPVPDANYPPTEIDLRKDGQEFTISDAADPAANLKFSVKFLRDTPLPKPLFIRMIGSPTEPLLQAVDPQGHATFASVNPSSYRVIVGSDASLYPIVRATSQGQPISVSPLKITSGANLDVTLVLSDSNVSVEGFVKHNGHPVAGAMVVLLSTDPASHFLRRDQTDSDGSFMLPAVFPGSYKVIALEGAWTLPWPDATTLRHHLIQSQATTISPNSESPVQLSMPLDLQPR